ncbi:MAG: A24 family peptidase [Pseudomonadota bacterium]
MTIIDLFAQSPAIFIGVVFVFSLLVGSFLNVVIYRLPVMMQREWAEQCAELEERDVPEQEPFNLVVPRSRCPHCGHAITALENIPLISWVVLRGKCSNCKTPISVRYPLVELGTAILAAVVAWRFGFGIEALAGILLTYALVALSMIDVDHQLLPDSIVLPFLWLGMLLTLARGFEDADVLLIEPAAAIVGAVVGYLSLYSVATLFRMVTGKVGMGEGDFKLLALFGAWLGVAKLPIIILLSAGVGSVVGIAMILFMGRDRQLPIPFGPYLAAAGWLAMVFGDSLLDWYNQTFGITPTPPL